MHEKPLDVSCVPLVLACLYVERFVMHEKETGGGGEKGRGARANV